MRLLRPHHWIKNVFVLAPLLFGGVITGTSLLRSATAFGCFCLLSSGIYCLNDVIDAAADRQHPRKRARPVASGRVSIRVALLLSACIIGVAMLWGSTLPRAFSLFGVLYVANNLLYCVWLKHRVIVDVLLIAIGFVLRIMAGCAALEIRPTSWVVICGFSLALLLGFGKRRLEIESLGSDVRVRRSLQSYSVDKINLLLAISSAMCLISYMLYSVSPQTVQIHHTENLIYTVPPVLYGVFRYLFKVQEGRHDGPVEVMLKDWVFALNGILWILLVVAILYVPALK
jgi:4-hydroxybenzoate polyprenyltransferase